jgi:hypothetical protein
MSGSGLGSVSALVASLTALSPFSLVLMIPARVQGCSGEVFYPIEVITEGLLSGVQGLTLLQTVRFAFVSNH